MEATRQGRKRERERERERDTDLGFNWLLNDLSLLRTIILLLIISLLDHISALFRFVFFTLLHLFLMSCFVVFLDLHNFIVVVFDNYRVVGFCYRFLIICLIELLLLLLLLLLGDGLTGFILSARERG